MPWDFWLIFFALGVLLPWRGRARMKKLLAMTQVSSMERLVLYASTIAFQWLAVAVVGWRVWVHGYSARQLGLVFHGRTRLLLGGLVGAAIMGGLQWLNLRRVGRIPPGSRGGMQAGGRGLLPPSSLGGVSFLPPPPTPGGCGECFLFGVFFRSGEG